MSAVQELLSNCRTSFSTQYCVILIETTEKSRFCLAEFSRNFLLGSTYFYALDSKTAEAYTDGRGNLKELTNSALIAGVLHSIPGDC